MKAQFLILAAVPAAIAAPAWSATYLSVAQAQALMFPHATLAQDFHTLTPQQAAEIKAKSGVNVLTKELKTWKAPDGGRLYVDEVVGKHEFITLALALDPSGAVRDVEIMEYRESYGGQVRDPAWRAQFVGKRDGAPLTLDKDIRNNSGGTLSARHVTDGVKRLLATNTAVFGAPHA